MKEITVLLLRLVGLALSVTAGHFLFAYPFIVGSGLGVYVLLLVIAAYLEAQQVKSVRELR